MTFLPRTAWAVHTPTWTPLPATPHSVVHHTAARYTGTGLADLIGHLRQLELAEMGRGDGLIALAYHRMYAPDGTSIEARPIGAQGGATLKHNSDSRAYCFLGNFQTDTPTRAALLACAADIRADLRAGHLTGSGHPTWGHRDVFATACPGANLYPALPALRQLVLDTPAAPSPAPVSQEFDVQPSDVTGHLKTEHGEWYQTADGGIITLAGPYLGSYPELLQKGQADKARYFYAPPEPRADGKPGYVLTAADATDKGGRYAFPVG